MKKRTIFGVLAIIAATITGATSFGQYSKNAMLFNPATLMHSSEVLLAGEESDKAAIEKLKAVNLKLHKDFIRFFKDAEDIRIADTKNGTFISCKVNGVTNRVFYNSKGKWMHTIKYLSISQTPQHVLETVKAEFGGFTLLNTTEVQVGNKTAYLVNIENAKAFKTIRVVDEEWDVYKQYSK